MIKLRLSWDEDQNEGSTIFDLSDSIVNIGRASSNDVLLSHSSISRRHAAIYKTPHGVFLEDLDSRFGTFVNGVAVAPHTPASIELNTSIRLGSLVIQLSELHSEPTLTFSPSEDLCTTSLFDAINQLEKSTFEKLALNESSPEELEKQQYLKQAFVNTNEKILNWTEQNAVIQRIYLLLNQTPSYQGFLNKVLPMLANVFKADRGFILEFDKCQRKLVTSSSYKYNRNNHQQPLDSNELFSQTIARRCYDENEVILVTDACQDKSFLQTVSVQNFSIKSALAFPLSYGKRIMGVVYLDHQSNCDQFNENQRPFVRSLQINVSTALRSTIHYSQAITDDLTGLYTRKYFEERIRQAMEQSLRYSSQCSLLLLDIDHFKAINDTYGHNCGDQVLREVSKLLADSARKSDVVGRLGGEEFVFLLAETGELGAIQYAERLRADIADLTIQYEDKEVKVTASFGITTYHSRLGTMEYKFIEEADHAMYLAKKAGRDRVQAIKKKFVEALRTQAIDPTLTD